MGTRKIFILTALLALVFALGACMDDDDVKDTVEYNLRIENNTDSSYDVFIDNGLSNAGPYAAGHVAAHRHTIIHELDIGVDYTVHLVNPGDGFDSPVHERTVHSQSEDVTWTIN